MQKIFKQKSKTLLKSSLILALLIILVGCSTPFEKTLKQVEKIDSHYGISLADYEQGLSYFDTHIRDIPLNEKELNTIISQLEKLKEGKDNKSIEYLNFRIKLFDAERLYKQGARRPFADYTGPVKCSKTEEFLLSINEIREAINLTLDAKEHYDVLNESLDIAENWDRKMEKYNQEIINLLDSKENLVINF